MGLFKRAHLRGMAHELTRQGIVTWPSKLAEEEAADAVADNLEEEEVPEVTEEEGLTPEQAQEALDKLVEVAEAIAEKTSGARDLGVNKEAASISYEDAAMNAAISVMEKAAEETAVETGPEIPGQTAPTPDLGATAEGEVDAAKTPSADLVVPQGTSDVDTRGGAVGQETPQAAQPGGEENPPDGEVAKLSHLLRKMASVDWAKEAIDGASLSGGPAKGPAPAARIDLNDNLEIPGVVAANRGQTSQKIPEGAMVGSLLKQPAGTPGPTAPTPNDPSSDVAKQAAFVLRSSPTGRAFLKKLSEEMKNEEEEEKKKEEEKKEAAVNVALKALAQAIQ